MRALSLVFVPLLAVLAVVLLLAVPAAFAADAETWAHVPLLDAQCSTKFKTNPDDHPRACALQCMKSGFGIVAADGAWLTFDEAGNKQAIAALKGSDRSDHLRVTVKGVRQGSRIQVESLTLDTPKE